MTIEDPIEYLHRDYQSIVNQREVSVDTSSFAKALRSALRQDPDVILVGEMRDFETVETALLAAETGHLVFSTLHTLDATETVNRIIAVFPPHQQRQVRIQLSSVLKAAISQRLMPRADGLGRVPAVEVMEGQRERARAKSSFKDAEKALSLSMSADVEQALDAAGDQFAGYDTTSVQGTPIVALFDDSGASVEELGSGMLIRANDRPVTIVGVAEAGFRGTTLFSNPDIFLPLTSSPAIRTGFM